MRLTCLLLLFSLFARAQTTLQAPGSWREHLPYQNALAVAASETTIYTATPYSLFELDLATGELTRRSKVSGLSATGIAAMARDARTGRLFIGYANSNIDVLDSRGIHNIPDLERRTTAGDKRIYHFFPDGDRCYVSTGLGVLVLDAVRDEVRDAWFIGAGGRQTAVFSFTRDDQFFYAATAEGLRRAPIGHPNLADFSAWQLLSGQGGLPAGPARQVVNLEGRILAQQQDTVFMLSGNSWTPFFANGRPIVSLSVSAGRVAVSQGTAAGGGQVVFLDANGQAVQTLGPGAPLSFPQDALVRGSEYWVADLYGGLLRWNGSGYTQYQPTSPDNIATGELKVANGTLYAAAGSVNSAWNYLYNPNGAYRFREGGWTSFNRFRYPSLDSLLDVITLAPDPRDGTLWAGAYGGGLWQLGENGQLARFRANGGLQAPPGDPGSFRVSGLAFDRDNHLWIANFGSPRPLVVRLADGGFRSFTPPFSLFENAVAQVLVDQQNRKWIVAPKGNGLIVFDHGASVDNTADDRWRLFRAGTGNGNLPAAEVLSVAEDRNGLIWVGTSDGIGVLQCPASPFDPACEALLPVIRDGSFASYLFKGEEVRSIAVDGADRKWVATANGAWLVDAVGENVLLHFTEDNSPLLSNDVRGIAIDGRSGEVYFGTGAGIISYRSDATDAAAHEGKALVFPNPVPPGHDGPIAIRGLPENALVKITEPDGRLVYQTRALGGQAVWNGRNYQGRRAATGIYLVLVSITGQREHVAGKIVFVGR